MAVKKETLSYIEICNDIAKSNFAPIYVLMGEESFYIDQIENMIVSKALSNDEKLWLELFRQIPSESRPLVLSMIKAALKNL